MLKVRKVVEERGGQAVIETAVVLPLFFLCMVGIFELGFMMFSFCSANYAARMGARYASIHSSTSLSPATVASVTYVVEQNLWVHSSSASAVIVCWSGGCSNPVNNVVGNLVGVGVTWWNPPFLGNGSQVFATQAYQIVTH